MSLYPGRFLKPSRQVTKAYRAGSRPMTVTRRGFDVALYYFTLAPTTESHCLVMTVFAAACSSRVGNTALA